MQIIMMNKKRIVKGNADLRTWGDNLKSVFPF